MRDAFVGSVACDAPSVPGHESPGTGGHVIDPETPLVVGDPEVGPLARDHPERHLRMHVAEDHEAARALEDVDARLSDGVGPEVEVVAAARG